MTSFDLNLEEIDIAVIHTSTHDQLADQFTKELAVELFMKTRKKLMGWEGPTGVNENQNIRGGIKYPLSELLYKGNPFRLIPHTRMCQIMYSTKNHTSNTQKI